MNRRPAAAFTIVELLVVIAIIGTLVGLLLPAVQSARESARRTDCTNRLKQLGLAMHLHHDAKGRFPSAYESQIEPASPYGPPNADTLDAAPGWAWGTQLLPYLEQQTLFEQLKRNRPCWHADNAAIVATRLEVFLCPSANGTEESAVIKNGSGTALATFGRSCYVANAGQEEPWGTTVESYQGIADGPLYRNSRTRAKDVTDGLSKTVFLGEHHPRISDKTWVGVVPGAAVCPAPEFAFADCDAAATLVNVHSGPSASEVPPAIHPPNSPLCHVCQMYAEHPGGCNVMLGDGSVRFINELIHQPTWAALSSRAEGDAVEGDW